MSSSSISLGLGVSLVSQTMELATQPGEDGLGPVEYFHSSDAAPARKIAAAVHAGRTPSFLAGQFMEIVGREYPRAG